jgi:hypothetical protein
LVAFQNGGVGHANRWQFKMKPYSYFGQSAWFAFGAWTGAVTWIFVDILQGHPFRIRHIVDDGSFLPYFVALYIPCALLFSFPFLAWQAFRTRRARVVALTPWPVPLLSGLVYFPIVGAMIPILCIVTNQGQGSRIGTAVCVLVFGLPLLFGEFCLRVGQLMTQDAPRPSDFHGDTAGNAA